MTVKEIKNNTVRNIVRLALAKQYVVTILKFEKKIFNGIPLRIKKNGILGAEILKYFLDNVTIKQLNITILEDSIVIYDNESK